jgi:hypothetical protein
MSFHIVLPSIGLPASTRANVGNGMPIRFDAAASVNPPTIRQAFIASPIFMWRFYLKVFSLSRKELDTETQLCYYPEQIYGGSFK